MSGLKTIVVDAVVARTLHPSNEEASGTPMLNFFAEEKVGPSAAWGLSQMTSVFKPHIMDMCFYREYNARVLRSFISYQPRIPPVIATLCTVSVNALGSILFRGHIWKIPGTEKE